MQKCVWFNIVFLAAITPGADGFELINTCPR